MKKSQLRKIIRESIRGLMNEQTGSDDCCFVTSEICDPQAGQYTGTFSTATPIKIGGQLPQVGDSFISMDMNANGSVNWGTQTNWRVTAMYIPWPGHACSGLSCIPDGYVYCGNVMNCVNKQPATCSSVSQDHVCYDSNCLDCSGNGAQYCNAPGATIYPDLAACQTVLAANKGRCPLGCSATCDASAWPNHANWISTWTSLPNFTSSNPNQPCQHICQKITQWTAACANAGPVQQNQLACKIAEGQNQHTIHNCSNSNASAC